MIKKLKQYIYNTILQIGDQMYEIDDNKLAILFNNQNIPTTIKLDVKSEGDTKELLSIKPDPRKSGVSQENPNSQRIPHVLHGDEDAIRMIEKLNRERDLRQGTGGKREKMQATNERVLLPGKKRASVVYLQGKTKYVRKCGDWETLKKAARRMS